MPNDEGKVGISPGAKWPLTRQLQVPLLIIIIQDDENQRDALPF